MKGTGPSRLKQVTLATNPFRLSYYGKEIVFARYSFLKKLKRNQLPPITHAQERTRAELRQAEADDGLKVAKTLLL